MLHWSLCEHPSIWGSEESELLGPFTRHLEEVYRQARRFKGRNWLEAQEVDLDTFFACMGAGIEALYATALAQRDATDGAVLRSCAVRAIRSGAAGGAYALLFSYVGASFASILHSIYPLLWTLLGGAGTTLGPLVGTGLMFYLIDVTSGWTAAW